MASDAADPIVITCAGGFALVNGVAPNTGPVTCRAVNRLSVTGGPGDNRIDASRFALAPLMDTQGVSASAEIDGGAGDDDIRGPTMGIARMVGGAGSDRLEGNGIERYAFGEATSEEVDTIVDPSRPVCSPSFFDLNSYNVTTYSVSWDALDFTALPADDGVVVDSSAPAGLLARHRNRTVRLVSGGGIAIEAIAGGAGADVLSGGCMVVGNAGDDRLTGSVARGDLVLGGPGADRLAGSGGPDLLAGGQGADSLDGGQGADTLSGGPQDDALAGGPAGDAYLFGTADGPQTDTLVEGVTRGLDVLSLEFSGSVFADLASHGPLLASAESTRVLVAPALAWNVEGVIGGSGDDRLLGNPGANHFWSGGGNDRMVGGRGDDTYHLNWIASMPNAAYGHWGGGWVGPFDPEDVPAHSPWDERLPVSTVEIVERARGGRDTLDAAEIFLPEGDREPIDGQLEGGARIDLSAPRWLMRSREIRAAASPGSSAHLERIRGTSYGDFLIGNAAANVLEGRRGADVVAGRGGRDTCVVHAREDKLRGCERIRAGGPL